MSKLGNEHTILRGNIEKAASDFIKSCIEGEMENTLALISTYAGSGKTFNVWNSIKKFRPIFAYFAPRHVVISQMHDLDHEMDVPHLFSKNHFDGDKPLCKYLQDHPKEAWLVRKGRMVASIFCNTCGHNRVVSKDDGTGELEYDCSIMTTHNLIKQPHVSWTGVHAHIGAFLPIHLADIGRKKYSLIILDENPFRSMYQKTSLRSRDLTDLEEFFEEDKVYPLVHNLKMRLVNETSNVDLKGFNFETFLSNHKDRIFEMDGSSFIPRYNDVMLIGRLADKIVSGKSVEDNIMVLNVFRDKIMKLAWYNRDMLNDVELPILALDATGSDNLWKTLAPSYDVTTLIRGEWENKRVVHLKGSGDYYLKTWQACDKYGDNHPNFKMLRRICAIAEGDVIVCCSKRIRSIIQEHVRNFDNLKFAIFMSLTSDNSLWRNARVVVIAGRPTIPPPERKFMLGVTNFSSEVMDYIHIESEVVQGIGRVRQNIPEADVMKNNLRKHKIKRDAINIIVLPELKNNDPFANIDHLDPNETMSRLSRRAFIESLDHGFLYPIEYYAKKIFDMIGEDGITETMIYRNGCSRDYVLPSLYNLEREGKIIRRGPRWYLK